MTLARMHYDSGPTLGRSLGRFIVVAVTTLALLAAPEEAQAQSREITGTVTSQNTKQPLPDITVTVLGQQAGARTKTRRPRESAV